MTRVWGLVAVVACSAPSEPPPRNATLLSKGPGEVSPSTLKDLDFERGASTPRDCRPSTHLQRFDPSVTNCGTVEDRGRPPGTPVSPLIVAARVCATEAMAAHRPFIVRWHSSAGDPFCNEMAIQKGTSADDACGSMTIHQAWVLVGVAERGDYATYWLEYQWTRGVEAKMNRQPGSDGISVHGSSRLKRCAPLVALPLDDESSSCGDGSRFEYCFECRDHTEVAKCETDSKL